ncbi:MAG: asparagine synthetase B, partial [Acidobacteria bacterium]|nr:asparagine synthetase B [Acidobacteriota bacterium]
LAALPSPAVIDSASRLIPAGRRPPNLGDKVHKAASLLREGEDAWPAFAGIWPASALGQRPLAPATPVVRAQVDAVERMMLVDTAAVLPDQMLVKVDRASMAVALEVRVPLLDHRLLEWSWRQPTHIRTSGGVGKLVLRRVAERTLPSDIVRRPKMGFDPPLGGWLRGELRPWAEDLLRSPRCVEEGWLDGAALRSTWAQHLDGKRNNEYRVWAVLMLEQWMETHHTR